MAVAFWDSQPASYVQLVHDIGAISPWDVAYLNGTLIPGLTSLEGEPGRKIDIQSAPGTDGASIRDQGFDPAKPTLAVRIWTPAQWEQFQAFLTVFTPKPGKSTQKPTAAIQLSHPGANALGITAIIITSISIPKPGGTPGIWESQIKCIQWVKPKAAIIVDVNFGAPNVSGIGGGAPSSNNTAPFTGA